MSRTRPPYPPQFRIEAVRMLRAGVRTPKQLAVEPGCSQQTLRNWLRQDEADRGERQDVLTSEERLASPDLARPFSLGAPGARCCSGCPLRRFSVVTRPIGWSWSRLRSESALRGFQRRVPRARSREDSTSAG